MENGAGTRYRPAMPANDNVIPFKPNPWGQKPPPLLNIPPATKWFALLLVIIYAASAYLLNDEQHYWLDAHFGFVAGAYTGRAPFKWYALAAPLTYMLLHGGWDHVGLNAVMLVAFGSGVERWMGAKRMLVLFVLCGIASVAVQFALSPFATEPVIGASGGLSGLFAAILIMMRDRGAMPTGRYGLWPLIILWVVVSVVLGVLGGPEGEAVAWAAHIGGFAAGLALLKFVPWFQRGGREQS